MRIQQDMRHRQTHHFGGEKQITRFSHYNFLLLLYALFATLKIGNILWRGNSVSWVLKIHYPIFFSFFFQLQFIGRVLVSCICLFCGNIGLRNDLKSIQTVIPFKMLFISLIVSVFDVKLYYWFQCIWIVWRTQLLLFFRGAIQWHILARNPFYTDFVNLMC